tara:strand:+ start:59191 stop:60552 length:1362 start_codon:yes stop_codon:yes gene_type:complete
LGLFSCRSAKEALPEVTIDTPRDTAQQVITQDTAEEYFTEEFMRYSDYVYSDSIKTVQLYNLNDAANTFKELNLPVITLNSNQKLRLEFDDLAAVFKTYTYDIIYCNADWTPSNIPQQQYLQGFSGDFINDYAFSFNTYISYIHYKVDFPNEYTTLLKSGNYLLVVKNNEGKPVITKRFYVQENKYVELDSIAIHPATKAEYRFTKQEVDFSLQIFDELPVTNIYEEIKVIVSQNFRMDNAKVDLKPKYINDRLLMYDYEDENTFFGLNEFRSFDISNFKYNSKYVKKYTLKNNRVEAELITSQQRGFKQYFQEPDINGKFYINRTESSKENIDVEADYFMTKFSLQTVNQFNNGKVYIFGGLTNWEILPEYEMKWNAQTQKFENELWLKQGYYNYYYAYVRDNDGGKVDLTDMEGSYSQTENDYYIFVYFRQQSENFDRLLAVFRNNSLRRY